MRLGMRGVGVGRSAIMSDVERIRRGSLSLLEFDTQALTLPLWCAWLVFSNSRLQRLQTRDADVDNMILICTNV